MLQSEIVASYYTISTLFDATTDIFSMLRNAQNGSMAERLDPKQNKTFMQDVRQKTRHSDETFTLGNIMHPSKSVTVCRYIVNIAEYS